MSIEQFKRSGVHVVYDRCVVCDGWYVETRLGPLSSEIMGTPCSCAYPTPPKKRVLPDAGNEP